MSTKRQQQVLPESRVLLVLLVRLVLLVSLVRPVLPGLRVQLVLLVSLVCQESSCDLAAIKATCLLEFNVSCAR
jgi:uncharacterized protein YqgC (DUF456 family)